MNLALFDFDGTITTHGMLPEFLQFAAPRQRILPGRIILGPPFLGYKLGLVSGSVMRACATYVAFRGLPAASVRQAGEDFARTVLPEVMRPHALERIGWHRAQGDTVVVVSGSVDLYLSPWCAAQQIDLLCSQLEATGDHLTGRYLGAQCVGAEKVRRIRARYHLDDFDAVYAYGDTEEDRDMLAIADRKYFRWAEIDD